MHLQSHAFSLSNVITRLERLMWGHFWHKTANVRFSPFVSFFKLFTFESIMNTKGSPVYRFWAVNLFSTASSSPWKCSFTNCLLTSAPSRMHQYTWKPVSNILRTPSQRMWKRSAAVHERDENWAIGNLNPLSLKNMNWRTWVASFSFLLWPGDQTIKCCKFQV